MTVVPTQPSAEHDVERLYRQHAVDVYRYTLALVGNPADAEDITQTTFLNAYRAVARGKQPDKAHNWLIVIAHNLCRQRFRQAKRRPHELPLNEELAEANPRAEGPSAEDIRRALDCLPFNQRAALVMRELRGDSYTDVAARLGITVSALETVLFRARRALREQLEGALTCQQAALAVSRQLDGQLSAGERGALRAHLRECRQCASAARRQRAQHRVQRVLALVPLPGSLSSFLSRRAGRATIRGGASAKGAALGSALTAKAGAVLVAGSLLSLGGYEAVQQLPRLGATMHPHVRESPAARTGGIVRGRAPATRHAVHLVPARPGREYRLSVKHGSGAPLAHAAAPASGSFSGQISEPPRKRANAQPPGRAKSPPTKAQRPTKVKPPTRQPPAHPGALAARQSAAPQPQAKPQHPAQSAAQPPGQSGAQPPVQSGAPPAQQPPSATPGAGGQGRR